MMRSTRSEMRRFREKLIRFMYGRYGADVSYFADRLNRFILILMVVLVIVKLPLRLIPDGLASSLIQLFLSIAALAMYIWFLFRFLSKNIYKRRQENITYLNLSRSLKRLFTFNTSNGTKSNNCDDAYYIFRDCTKCGATLRLPRRNGKHSVKCPKCAHSFYVRSK